VLLPLLGQFYSAFISLLLSKEQKDNYEKNQSEIKIYNNHETPWKAKINCTFWLKPYLMIFFTKS